MSRIRIITDSAADFEYTPEGVTILPMTIRFGNEEYQDGVTLTHREFYEKLVESDVLPETSLIPPGDFGIAFQKAADAGEQVLAITISSKLSGTYQSAMLAAEDYPGQVFVVDSLNAAIGQQVLVLYALTLVQRGWAMEDILTELEQVKTRLHTIALLDTLEYLKKGGRISKTVAFVGGMLSIKPVVAIQDGEVAMLGTARGSRNGNNFLIKEIEKAAGIDFSKPLCLGYTGLEDGLLQKYIQDSEELWTGHEDALRISSIGATIGTHIGPGAIAVAFFSGNSIQV